MENEIIELNQRFDLSQTESLVSQLVNFFKDRPVRIQTQLDLFPGFDELAVLMQSGVVYRCLVSGGKQVSDWAVVQKEASR